MSQDSDRGPNYLLCVQCDEPAFSWMAEAFCCPVCGCDTYEHPDGMSETDLPTIMQTRYDEDKGREEVLWRPEKKRKREN